MTSNEIELNVDTYTSQELFDILRIPSTSSYEQINATASRIISKFLSRNDNRMAMFFANIKKRLMEEWLDQNGGSLFDDAVAEEDPIGERVGNLQIVNRRPQHTIPVVSAAVAAGDINPNQVNTKTVTITVDSSWRNEIEPYDPEDPTVQSSSSNFEVSLGSPINGCISLELTSISIPKSWYNIDAFIGTNVMWINDVSLSVASGFYSPEQLAQTLTTNAQLPLKDVSYNPITGKFSMNFINLTPTPLAVKVVFWDRSSVLTNPNASTLAIANARVDFNLGYIMGYREPGPYSSYSFTLGVSPDNTYTYTASAVANLHGTKNLYIMVEDHNQNRPSSQSLSAARVEKLIVENNKFVPPDLSYACIFGEQTPFYYNNAPGSGMTKAKLYTINAIAANQTFNKDRINGPQQANILAVIPVSTYDVGFGQNIVASAAQLRGMTNKRVFFGPVSIKKLNVKLIDDIGNIINLNGRDWSFTMNSVNLYQYV